MVASPDESYPELSLDAQKNDLSRFYLCVEQDLNLRRINPSDLQSDAIDHSAIDA